MIRFPPRLFMQCHFLYRERAQTRKILLSEPSKTGFGRRALWYVSPPPPPPSKIARFVAPPPLAVSQCYTKATSKKFRPPSRNAPPEPTPETCEKSLQELFQLGGCLNLPLRRTQHRFPIKAAVCCLKGFYFTRAGVLCFGHFLGPRASADN